MDINDNTPTLKDMYITFNNFVQKSTSSRPALMEDVAGDETEFPINQVIGKLNFYDPDVMDIFEFGQEGQEELVKVNTGF
jgi:myo-inositol catabolism protein IolC